MIAGYPAGWLSETIMRVTDVGAGDPPADLALALAQIMSAVAGKRHARFVADLLAVLHPHRPMARRGASLVRCSSMPCAGSAPAPRAIVFLHILPTHVAGDRACHHRARLHHPGRGRRAFWAWAPRRRRPIGAWHRREPHLPTARLVYATFPRAAILITVMGFNLLGDGLRESVDPRIRRSR